MEDNKGGINFEVKRGVRVFRDYIDSFNLINLRSSDTVYTYNSEISVHNQAR